jgi:Prephenate dehydratase
MGFEEELAPLRLRIDDIDAQLAPLFEARMKASGEIATVKQRYGKPVFDAAREDAVIVRAISRLAYPNNAETARRFYRALMDLSKERQHERIAPQTPGGAGSGPVGFLGLPGSFSHIAAMDAFDAGRLRGYDTFEAIFIALREGGIDRAIVPAENTDTGSITAVADLLSKYGFYIVAERLLSVTQSLLGIPGAAAEGIRTVYTHPEPIMQCSRYLEEHADMRACPALSTSQAAMKVAELNDPSVACIASAQAAPIYKLAVLAEGIQNSSGNCTRFVVIARRPELSPMCDKTSIIFKVEHKPGSLCEVLRLFSNAGVNVLKLESRPLRDRPFEYLFHLDFEGSIEDERVASVIEAARSVTAALTWLGSYPRRTL